MIEHNGRIEAKRPRRDSKLAIKKQIMNNFMDSEQKTTLQGKIEEIKTKFQNGDLSKQDIQSEIQAQKAQISEKVKGQVQSRLSEASIDISEYEAPKFESRDEALAAFAEKLGIEVEGKTTEELNTLISEALKEQHNNKAQEHNPRQRFRRS